MAGKRRTRKDLLNEGDYVMINMRDEFSAKPVNNWVEAQVVDLMSRQFTAELVSGRIIYRMYDSEGTQWRKKDE